MNINQCCMVHHDKIILLSTHFQPSQWWVQIVVVMLFCSMLEINDVVLYCEGNPLSDAAATRPKSCTITVSSPSSESSHASLGSPVTEVRHMSLGSIESQLYLSSITSSDLNKASVGSSDSALESVGSGCSLETGDAGIPTPLSPVCEEQREIALKQGEIISYSVSYRYSEFHHPNLLLESTS